jgi:uncharacterized RmlC-like cupin family protein
VSEPVIELAKGSYLVDFYENWCRGEGIPIYKDFAIDMLSIEVKPWSRYNVNGAFCHLKGRCDYLTIFLLDLPPGARTAPQKHIYEDVVYVLEGHGATTVEFGDGLKHTFEWGPRSVFSIPLNARYQHFNGSGRNRARLASTNSLRHILNVFRNEDFVFNNSASFPDREGQQGYFGGEGAFVTIRPGRHQWETNFVSDIANFELQAWAARGAGGKSLRFILAESSIGVHVSELPVGTYKKAHRHPPGYCVFAVTGHGYSLLWYEGDKDFVRTDWHPGVVYAPPDMMFHQHFNTATTPARYLAVQMGSTRYPLFQNKIYTYDIGADSSTDEGGNQIEYKDQDSRIHEIFLKELEKHGVQSHMGEFISERKPT